jgi:hypothetical protein
LILWLSILSYRINGRFCTKAEFEVHSRHQEPVATKQTEASTMSKDSTTGSDTSAPLTAATITELLANMQEQMFTRMDERLEAKLSTIELQDKPQEPIQPTKSVPPNPNDTQKDDGHSQASIPQLVFLPPSGQPSSPQQGPVFIPPSTAGTSNGASQIPSLAHPFHHVSEATINSILSHTFNPYELYKLDPRRI